MDLGGEVKAPMRRTTSSGQRDGGAFTIFSVKYGLLARVRKNEAALLIHVACHLALMSGDGEWFVAVAPAGRRGTVLRRW